jgi:hypothetical protein
MICNKATNLNKKKYISEQMHLRFEKLQITDLSRDQDLKDKVYILYNIEL